MIIWYHITSIDHFLRITLPFPSQYAAPDFRVADVLKYCFCVMYYQTDRGGWQLPPDKLETAKREVELVSDFETLREEEDRLRSAPALVAVEEELNKQWFLTNVVDHRSGLE